MNARTIYIKRTRDGGSVITEHRVWDADRFFAAQVEQYSGPRVNPKDRHTVTLSTADEYRGKK